MGDTMTTEEMIVDAYKRGFTWGVESGGAETYLDKAAWDYADKTLSAAPVPPSEPVAWRMPLQGAKGKYQLTQHDDIAAMWRENGATVLPLYAVPPSPPRDEVAEALRGCISFRNWEIAEGGVVPDELRDVWKRAEAALQKLESPHD